MAFKPLPKKQREVISEYIGSEDAKCARSMDGGCNGRLTVQHCFGRTKQYDWQQIIICSYHHEGGGKNKIKDIWLALNQATDADLRKMKTYDELVQKKKWLNSVYGGDKL